MISCNPARRVSPAVLILVLVLAAACGSSNPTSPGSTPAVSTSSATSPGTSSGPTSGSTGTLTVMLKDSPFNAQALLVTFTDVSAHRSGGVEGDTGEWVSLSPVPFTRTCDLMKLKTAQDVLGTGLVKAGHYTQIRLKVDSATIYDAPTTGLACDTSLAPPPSFVESFNVEVPSDTIKLNREFDVAADKEIVITLDFDGDKSIHQTGNGKFKMTPVIAILTVH